ncbi:MAG: hypothetical protein HKP58_18970 [Desulfatitalea sp.]|nr:substrate-binding domain-containing protein [Desulfatitalea sp.]NNK02498.1 hypothetical protein [Desulfatitalea sp.]
MRIKKLIWVIVFLALLPALASAEDVVVITNPSVSAVALRKKDVRNIYRGKKTTWDDGSKIVFVVLKKSPTHDRFLKKYLGKTDAQFDRFWQKQVFAGKGIPPRAFDSDQAIVNFVANTPGAIGYISADTKIANVKIITVQ